MTSLVTKRSKAKDELPKLNTTANASLAAPSQYSSSLISRKTIALALLILQNASVSLLTRLSRTPKAGQAVYNPSEAVFVAELLKVSVSLTMLARERRRLARGKKDGTSPGLVGCAKEALRDLVVNQRQEMVKLSVPAALYALQNTLLYVALSNLDAATYQATYQLKLLTTALFSVAIFRTSLSFAKWLALLGLTIGVATVQLDGTPSSTTESRIGNRNVGLLAILAACISSGLAGAWFEYILKSPSPAPPPQPQTPLSAGSSTPSHSHSRTTSTSSNSSSSSPRRPKPQLRLNSPSLWARNLQLSIPSLIFSLSGVFLSAEWNEVDHWALKGFTGLVWSVVVNQALGGLLVAMVVREADSVAKGFATSIALVLSTLASVLFFGLMPGILFLVGAGLVCFSTVMYALDQSP